MSDHAIRTPADRRLSADELAAAIREGIEARDWRFDDTPLAAPFPTPDIDPSVHMPPLADLTEPVPLPAGTRFRSRFRRMAHVYLSGLLRPWLERQTNFNRLTAHLLFYVGRRAAERNDQAIARLTDRVDELTRLYFEATRRLDELAAGRPTP